MTHWSRLPVVRRGHAQLQQPWVQTRALSTPVRQLLLTANPPRSDTSHLHELHPKSWTPIQRRYYKSGVFLDCL